ncbi:DNA-binding IclR family transcriptional regulator [Crossiella equi]|uniref:DNA-binding IclR family transcriptional regulator n=1 Tax=Crossiella equi TaxID=130796 RepID=A0ABS5APP1_9PSEU|nr:helix-turn-helix domain-containing protein [Crossiella equi]MBP2478537.1 DNA-binding IclR family transcriptional regulator [Crossiella equi]
MNDFASGQLGAVQKAMLLLKAINPADPPVGISELARRVRLAKSTTHRLLNVMADYGFVRKQEDKYELGDRFDPLPEVPRPASLRESLLPFLADLYALTLGTVHLAVPCGGGELLYLDRVHGMRSPRCRVRPGMRADARSTAIGLVLLAFSPDRPADGELARELAGVRAEGLCLRPADGPELVSVAAPLLTAAGALVAAVSVTAPAARLLTGHTLSGIRSISHQARAALGPAVLGGQVARRG